MKILVVGNGGREHALIWKLKESPLVEKIFCAPGNYGTSLLATNITPNTTEGIVSWLENNRVDLVVVGPDHYLEQGIVDRIQGLKIPVFGPTRTAAEIEWSKLFAKEFMREEGIPTADFEMFSDIEEAQEYLKKQKFPLVIKANGLAAGKGVVVAKNLEEALKGLDLNLSKLGSASEKILVEKFLKGKEISIHAFSDGNTVKMFPSSRDHKKAFDNDKGDNTGGMGTIAPVPFVTEKDMAEIRDKIVLPTIRGLKRRGREFKGVLFPGIMLTRKGPYVIEFNARFGDPETQSYMRLLESDLVEILLSCVNGTLKDQEIIWSDKSACCIVCASGGYPGKYAKDKNISGLEKVNGVTIFHAGTKKDESRIITNGGRVLGVGAVGKNLNEALNKSYSEIKKISFEGMQYRRDIGKQTLMIKKDAIVKKASGWLRVRCGFLFHSTSLVVALISLGVAVVSLIYAIIAVDWARKGVNLTEQGVIPQLQEFNAKADIAVEFNSMTPKNFTIEKSQPFIVGLRPKNIGNAEPSYWKVGIYPCHHVRISNINEGKTWEYFTVQRGQTSLYYESRVPLIKNPEFPIPQEIIADLAITVDRSELTSMPTTTIPIALVVTEGEKTKLRLTFIYLDFDNKSQTIQQSILSINPNQVQEEMRIKRCY